jgi:predicted nucleotidyltransferase
MDMDLSDPISVVIPSLEGQVLRVLAHTTTPLSGSRIAELVTTGSNPGIRTALGRLVHHGTVLARRSGPSILYTANRDHLTWPTIEHAVQTADTLLDTLQDHIADLARAHLGQLDAESTTLALFGSVARGTSTLDSDIDIVAVFPDNLDAHTIEQLVDAVTAGVQRWTGNSCNVYDITSTRLAQMSAAHDPMIESWAADARTFLGPDLRRRLVES